MQCSWKSPHPHLPAPLSLAQGPLGDTAQTHKTQQHPKCHRVPCHQTSSVPSWKFEYHFIFMHSQHVLQPSPLFETKSPSPLSIDPSVRAGEAWPTCILLHTALPPSILFSHTAHQKVMDVCVDSWTQHQVLPQTPLHDLTPLDSPGFLR